jgi:hypothetical protein
MAKIRFIGDSVTCAWLGVSFTHGEWVIDHDLDDEQLARVALHPHFELEGLEPAAKPPAKAERAAKAAKAPAKAEAGTPAETEPQA